MAKNFRQNFLQQQRVALVALAEKRLKNNYYEEKREQLNKIYEEKYQKKFPEEARKRCTIPSKQNTVHHFQ